MKIKDLSGKNLVKDIESLEAGTFNLDVNTTLTAPDESEVILRYKEHTIGVKKIIGRGRIYVFSCLSIFGNRQLKTSGNRIFINNLLKDMTITDDSIKINEQILISQGQAKYTSGNETKVLSVKEKDYYTLVRQMSLFGWEERVHESIVDRQDSTTFYRVVFERDQDIPNLDRIRELESAYPFGDPPPWTPPVEDDFSGLLMIFGGLTALGGLFFTIGNIITNSDSDYSLNTTIAALIIGLVMVGIGFLWHSVKNEPGRQQRKIHDDVYKQQAEIENILRVENLIQSKK